MSTILMVRQTKLKCMVIVSSNQKILLKSITRKEVENLSPKIGLEMYKSQASQKQPLGDISDS